MQGATDDIDGGSVDPEFYGEPDYEKEPYTHYVQSLAQKGPEGIGEHGDVSAMGVPRSELPFWDDLQILTAQLARTPLDDDVPVDTELVIGPNAENPLQLDIPIFVSDMSFGALSEEAKIAISKGADQAGTGICSGEGGMLPEEQEANSRYFYEYATGKFGWDINLVERVQAFHFKAGQGAKTGTGGHLPGEKVQGRIAEVRDLEPGTDAVSPARFDDLRTSEDFAEMADRALYLVVAGPLGDAFEFVRFAIQLVDEDGKRDLVAVVACDGFLKLVVGHAFDLRGDGPPRRTRRSTT